MAYDHCTRIIKKHLYNIITTVTDVNTPCSQISATALKCDHSRCDLKDSTWIWCDCHNLAMLKSLLISPACSYNVTWPLSIEIIDVSLRDRQKSHLFCFLNQRFGQEVFIKSLPKSTDIIFYIIKEIPPSFINVYWYFGWIAQHWSLIVSLTAQVTHSWQLCIWDVQSHSHGC